MTIHFDRVSECSVLPFDESSVIYLHCIDTSTEKFTPVTSFACMEICCVLGHFSFRSDFAVRRLCCFLWSKESKVKQAKHDSYGSCHLYFCRLFLGLSTFLSLHRALLYEEHFVLCYKEKTRAVR